MAPTEGQSPVFVIVQLGLIFLIIYWLLIRPQQKERQRHQALVAGLKKGDEIVTVGGVIGTVVHVEADRVTIRSGENTRLVVERGKVGGIVAGSSSGSAPPAS
jgi:preprotein translocase subunit YajC